MQQLSDEEIEAYLDSDDWIGKAGAFGYQDGHPWLKLTAGSANNVVGLPVERLRELLHQVGRTANRCRSVGQTLNHAAPFGTSD